MNSAIYIYYTPSWQPLADIVWPVLKQYCRKHNCINLFSPAKQDDEWAFYKMHKLNNILKYTYTDLIWVLDLDTLITNPEIKFTDFADNEHDIFITKDINGINAGSWIVRNTRASRDFVQKIVDNFSEPHEQILMNKYLDMVKVKYLPHPSINSYMYEWYNEIETGLNDWRKDHLLLHLPGLGFEQRIKIFKNLLNNG